MSRRLEHYREYLLETGRMRGRHSMDQAVLKDGLERSLRGRLAPKLRERNEDVHGYAQDAYAAPHVFYVVEDLVVGDNGGIKKLVLYEAPPSQPPLDQIQ